MKTKKPLIIFIIITALGWAGAVYFYIKNSRTAQELKQSREVSVTVINSLKAKFEKGRAYVGALEKFEFFRRQRNNQTIEDLKTAVEAANNGALRAELDDILLGGYKEKDKQEFMDTLIDALKFFWKE